MGQSGKSGDCERRAEPITPVGRSRRAKVDRGNGGLCRFHKFQLRDSRNKEVLLRTEVRGRAGADTR